MRNDFEGVQHLTPYHISSYLGPGEYLQLTGNQLITLERESGKGVFFNKKSGATPIIKHLK